MKIIASPDPLCPGQTATLILSELPLGTGTCTWKIISTDCELRIYQDPTPQYPPAQLSIRVQAFPNDTKGGKITAYVVTDGQDSLWKAFTVHGVHFEGRVKVSEGLNMEPGVQRMHYPALGDEGDMLRFGANTVVGNGVRFVGKCKIQLDGCARKAECANNFELGFLQKVVHQERLAEYEHGRIVTKAKGEVVNGKAPNLPLGLRDAASQGSVFYDDKKCRPFTGDATEQTTELFDNPGCDRAIEEEGLGKLKTVRMDIRFETWLAVRNVAWYAVKPDESMIFICNFEWKTTGDWLIDGKDVSTWASEIEVETINPGKGSVKPILDGPVANVQIKEKRIHEDGYWMKRIGKPKAAPVGSTKSKSYGTF
jgi:hypothetical protein